MVAGEMLVSGRPHRPMVNPRSISQGGRNYLMSPRRVWEVAGGTIDTPAQPRRGAPLPLWSRPWGALAPHLGSPVEIHSMPETSSVIAGDVDEESDTSQRGKEPSSRKQSPALLLLAVSPEPALLARHTRAAVCLVVVVVVVCRGNLAKRAWSAERHPGKRGRKRKPQDRVSDATEAR